MKETQPPAKWTVETQGEIAGRNCTFYKNKDDLCMLQDSLKEQLQSEAEEKGYKKGVFEQFTTVSKATQKEIEEARADEKAKAIKHELSKLQNIVQNMNPVNIYKQTIIELFRERESLIDKKEQPVSENKNNAGIFFSSPVEERK